MLYPNTDISYPEWVMPYMALAEALVAQDSSAAAVIADSPSLPPLTKAHLDMLGILIEKIGNTSPRHGWAIAAIVDEVASQTLDDLFLQALAAWHLACAANRWVRPNLAMKALDRARLGFTELGQTTWLAACAWQQNVHPWARPNLRQVIAELESALPELDRIGPSEIVSAAHCQLTLAYAQILAGDFAAARQNLEHCQEQFIQREDQLNLIRCQYVQAGALRRQSLFDQAVVELKVSLSAFHELSAPLDAALAQSHLAYNLSEQWEGQEGYQEAETHFLEAATQFERLDIPFWRAYSQQGLAQIYISSGRLVEAGESLAYCRQVYEEYAVAAPQAGVLIESGWLEMYRGNHEQSLAHLLQAEKLSQAVGNTYMHAISLMHLGETTLEMGRFQQALHYLEKAVEDFQILQSPSRMAGCELRLARCWTNLGRLEQTHLYLDLAEEHANQANQPSILPYLHSWRAEAFFNEGKRIEAVAALQDSLATAQQQGDPAGIALSHRLLGEALSMGGHHEEATGHLQAAETGFAEMGLVIAQAACHVAWGYYYERLANTAAAQAAWQQALHLVDRIAPDINWQAYAGLARLSEDSGDTAAALTNYRLAVQALADLRSNIWQPALAGFYLSRPAPVLDRAIVLAAQLGRTADVLAFIEASKAQTVAHLFNNNIPVEPAASDSQELVNLAAEIRWLQEHLRATYEADGWPIRPVGSQLRQELLQKVKKYDLLRDRQERRTASSSRPLSEGNGFDPNDFRRRATTELGEVWVALDYYLTDEWLIYTIISPETCETYKMALTNQIRLALTSLERTRLPGQWEQRDLDILGNWLLSDAILSALSADTVLLIAPHRRLHRLPWSALTAADQTLICHCIPVVAPSLHSLTLLWQRAKSDEPLAENGLLLAVSDFQARHVPLSRTISEVERLSKICPGSQILSNETATWSALRQMAENKGLARYSFLHIASHAFHDGLTGRLSGLALYDRDVWLDELQDCAPLPELITLSACSGSKSRLYEGDEHVGLTVTCLAAGARQVVASLWPVLDEDAADLMVSFFRYLRAGHGVAWSLALAQRGAHQAGLLLRQWAGFRCTGLP